MRCQWARSALLRGILRSCELQMQLLPWDCPGSLFIGFAIRLPDSARSAAECRWTPSEVQTFGGVSCRPCLAVRISSLVGIHCDVCSSQYQCRHVQRCTEAILVR